MADFDGTSFEERGETGRNNPQWSSAYILVIKKVPGGSLNVIHAIGADVQRLAMPISGTFSQVDNLVSAAGSDGTLSGWSGATTSALLEKVDSVIEVKPGVDLFWATLHFIKL